MGMRQRKCPRCKKWRPFEEGFNINERRRWKLDRHVLVCYWCAAKGVDMEPIDEAQERLDREETERVRREEEARIGEEIWLEEVLEEEGLLNNED